MSNPLHAHVVDVTVDLHQPIATLKYENDQGEVIKGKRKVLFRLWLSSPNLLAVEFSILSGEDMVVGRDDEGRFVLFHDPLYRSSKTATAKRIWISRFEMTCLVLLFQNNTFESTPSSSIERITKFLHWYTVKIWDLPMALMSITSVLGWLGVKGLDIFSVMEIWLRCDQIGGFVSTSLVEPHWQHTEDTMKIHRYVITIVISLSDSIK